MAQAPLPVQVVPLAVKDTPGRGGLASELTVANLGADEASVGIAWFTEGTGTPWNGTFPVRFPLKPGETRSLPDVVARAGGPPGATRGWLLVADATAIDCTSQNGPYPALLAVESRVAGAAGSTEIPASWLNLNVGALPSVVVGVPARLAARRIEVGAANISSQAMTMRIVALGPNGARVGVADRDLPARSLGLWRLSDLGLTMPEGGRLEVARADDSGDWNPCRVAASPPPCLDPCDPKGCPERYGLPGFPAFIAFALVTGPDGEPRYLPAVTDQVGAMRHGTAYRQLHCPEAGGFGRLVDLLSRVALLRDPRTIGPHELPGSPAATPVPRP